MSRRRIHLLPLALACAIPAPFAAAQSERVFLDGFDGPATFRLDDFDLRDPHVFVNFLGCRDVTDTPVVGYSVNGSLQTQIQADNDMPPDGYLDLSYIARLQPLDTLDFAVGTLDWSTANCTSPMASTTCSSNSSTPVLTTYTSQTTGTCLSPLPGTLRPYTPAITNSSAACFTTPATTIVTSLFGGPVVLHDARIAATWVGSPPTSVVNGLMMGFLTEADANATLIPASYPLVGGQPLSAQFPGGTGNCAAFSDKDINGGTPGWWMYFNFTAARVPYTP